MLIIHHNNYHNVLVWDPKESILVLLEISLKELSIDTKFIAIYQLKIAWSDEIYIFQMKILIYSWFYIPNLDIGALTDSLKQNNQWIYNLIPVDTCRDEAIMQGTHKQNRSISWPDFP